MGVIKKAVGITKLSELLIDLAKDWDGYRIENLGAPTASGHALRRGDEGLIDHNALLNYLAAKHLTLPATIASVLTDHTKAVHDALNIDADTLDATHLADIQQATKEIFVPVNRGENLVSYGNFPTAKIENVGDTGLVVIHVPHDFTALTAIEIIFIPFVTAPSMGISIDSNYAKVGENYATHSDTMSGVNMGATSTNIIKSFSIADAVDVAPLEAGDYIGIAPYYSATPNPTRIHLLGVRFRYT